MLSVVACSRQSDESVMSKKAERSSKYSQLATQSGTVENLIATDLRNGFYKYTDADTGTICYIYDAYKGAAMHCIEKSK